MSEQDLKVIKAIGMFILLSGNYCARMDEVASASNIVDLILNEAGFASDVEEA